MTPTYEHEHIEVDGVFITDDGYVMVDSLDYVAHIVWAERRWRLRYLDNWTRMTYKQNLRIMAVANPHLALPNITTRLTS